MITLKGNYNSAIIYTDDLESKAAAQIEELCNQQFCQGRTIRIMPDVHAGAGCTIGTTMTVQDKVVPNLVGVDIGCGMEVIVLEEHKLDPVKLDTVIQRMIPSGFDIRDHEHEYASLIDFAALKCKKHLKISRARLSIGTLGGGNHFIEANIDGQGNLYLVVHSGSRYLGKQVAEYYQDLAFTTLDDTNQRKQDLIKALKQQGRKKDIEKELKKMPSSRVSKNLAYLEGDNFRDYINDMAIVQYYASCNRRAIIDEITANMGIKIRDRFSTIHNYIDLNNMILRKGAISAQKGERVIIPMNMRDGSLIAIGKGNPEWNYSAPHGAGRLMSRSTAFKSVNLEEFEASMQGIYSTTVNARTLDESPMAYKPMENIIANTGETIEVVSIIKPIYNFKSA